MKNHEEENITSDESSAATYKVEEDEKLIGNKDIW